MGPQKNGFDEMVLVRTRNICDRTYKLSYFSTKIYVVGSQRTIKYPKQMLKLMDKQMFTNLCSQMDLYGYPKHKLSVQISKLESKIVISLNMCFGCSKEMRRFY